MACEPHLEGGVPSTPAWRRVLRVLIAILLWGWWGSGGAYRISKSGRHTLQRNLPEATAGQLQAALLRPSLLTSAGGKNELSEPFLKRSASYFKPESKKSLLQQTGWTGLDPGLPGLCRGFRSMSQLQCGSVFYHQGSHHL